MMKGIDISNHNGTLNFDIIKKNVDFVMVRAGYGTNTIDARAHRNFTACNEKDIPVGAYWFSYAHTISGAKEEAKNCCEFIKKYKIDLPVAYDFEYDSERYIQKWYNITPTQTLLCNLADAFFEVVESYGFKPMLYTNIDYLNRGFKHIVNNQLLWLAQWGVSKPSYNCYMWQSTDKHEIEGCNCNFDLNYLYEENDNDKAVNKLAKTDVDKIISNVINDYYLPVAQDVLKGKYGNGSERKKKLKEAGYDPCIVQCVVNFLLGA